MKSKSYWYIIFIDRWWHGDVLDNILNRKIYNQIIFLLVYQFNWSLRKYRIHCYIDEEKFCNLPAGRYRLSWPLRWSIYASAGLFESRSESTAHLFPVYCTPTCYVGPAVSPHWVSLLHGRWVNSAPGAQTLVASGQRIPSLGGQKCRRVDGSQSTRTGEAETWPVLWGRLHYSRGRGVLGDHSLSF